MTSIILTFIKDWLPSIGVVGASFWVLFQWIYDHKLRKNKEMPALSGEVKLEFVVYDKLRYIVCIKTEWNNSSPLPIFIDTLKSRIDVFQVHEDMKTGYFEPKKDLGKPIYRAFPLGDMGDFVFEPNKSNQVRGNFLLEKDKIYFLRIKIYRDKGKHGQKEFAWTREQIIDARNIKQTTNTNPQ